MLAFSKKIATSLLASSIIMGGVTPALAQYSCPSREIKSVYEVGDYKFELKGCQRSGKKVTCSVWLTQTNKDITFEYVNGTGYTRLVDAAGMEYPSASIQVSSQVANNPGQYVRVSLVKDIPIQLSATFADVPTSVQDIALFELASNYPVAIKGQLRNTQITESKSSNFPAIKKKK